MSRPTLFTASSLVVALCVSGCLEEPERRSVLDISITASGMREASIELDMEPGLKTIIAEATTTEDEAVIDLRVFDDDGNLESLSELRVPLEDASAVNGDIGRGQIEAEVPEGGTNFVQLPITWDGETQNGNSLNGTITFNNAPDFKSVSVTPAPLIPSNDQVIVTAVVLDSDGNPISLDCGFAFNGIWAPDILAPLTPDPAIQGLFTGIVPTPSQEGVAHFFCEADDPEASTAFTKFVVLQGPDLSDLDEDDLADYYDSLNAQIVAGNLAPAAATAAITGEDTNGDGVNEVHRGSIDGTTAYRWVDTDGDGKADEEVRSAHNGKPATLRFTSPGGTRYDTVWTDTNGDGQYDTGLRYTTGNHTPGAPSVPVAVPPGSTVIDPAN